MIELTKEADQHLCSILEKEGAHGVLLSVKGGGCAGFSYDWQLVDEPSCEAFSLSNGTLYIDPMAMLYVAGTILDYNKDVFGATLKLENPNVASACGCGESISFKEV